jgi:branched-chain amino acid transport system permease protein
MNVVQVVVSGIMIGGVYSLVSAGLTLIFGVLDVINFAHGSYLMLAMYVAYFAWSRAGLDPLVAVPIDAVVLAVAGYVTYWLVIRRTTRKGGIAQVVSTFGLLVLIQGVAEVLWTPNDRAVSNPLASRFQVTMGGVVVTGPQLIAFVAAIACTLGLAAFINHTKLGTAILATGEDRAAAALMGINVRSIDALVWALGLGCCGVAGPLLVNSYTVSPTAGVTFGLIAFFAVALGGFGSVLGAGIAGIVLGVAQDLSGLYAPQYSLAALMAIYLVVVVARPRGILGTR